MHIPGRATPRVIASLAVVCLLGRAVPTAHAQPATLVGDLQPGAGDSWPFSFTPIGPTLYFTANDGSTGGELWKTDGTAAGTTQVIDLIPGSGSPGIFHMIDVGGRLFFDAVNLPAFGVYTTDGTAAGTIKLGDHPPGNVVSDPTIVAAVDDTLYFTSWNGSAGYLWRSDGTPSGTYAVTQYDNAYSDATLLTATSNRVFFIAGLNPQLWTSDGTAPGTVPLGPVQLPHGPICNCCPISCIPAPSAYPIVAALGDTLFFVVNEAVGGEVHLVMWTSDGTSLTRLMDVGRFWYNGFTMGTAGGVLYLTVEGPTGMPEIWRTDGTLAGTTQVSDLSAAPPDALIDFTDVAGTLYFVGIGSGTHRTLWRSDGSAAGTALVAPFQVQGPASIPQLTAVGSTVFFTAFDACHGNEPWRSDGTAAGTLRADDIYPGPTSSDPYPVTSMGGAFYMGAVAPGVGRELWKIDPAGTPVVSSCGNGVVDAGEDCDEGPENGAAGSCCDACCAFVPAATTCRPATNGCDPREACTGTSATCPADVGPLTPYYARVSVGKLDQPDVDHVLRVDVRVGEPAYADAPTNGIVLHIERADTSSVADVDVPGGPPWQAPSPLLAKYGKFPGPGVNTVRVKHNAVDGTVQVKLKATGGTGSVTTADFPLTISVNPGYAGGATGECNPLTFPLEGCVVSGSGRSFTCKKR